MKPSPISVREAKELLDKGQNVTFVDSRNPTAWGESKEKLPGAIRIPADQVEKHLDELPKHATVVAYCT